MASLVACRLDPLRVEPDLATGIRDEGQDRLMRVITLGSGTAQTGKSFIAVNLGVALAARGIRTCLVDLDLASADLHCMAGCLNPKRTVSDLLRGKIDSLAEAMVPVAGMDHLHLVPGPRETLRFSSLSEGEITRLGSEVLRLPADVVIVDLETGVGQQLLDLSLAGDYQWVVSTTAKESIDAAARFLHLARLRRTARGSAGGQNRRPRVYTSLDDLVRDMNALKEDQLPAKDGAAVCPGLILNRSGQSPEDPDGRLLDGVLSLGESEDAPPIMAEIPEDPAVPLSIEGLKPLLAAAPESPAGRAITQLASSLIDDFHASAEILPAEHEAEPAHI